MWANYANKNEKEVRGGEEDRRGTGGARLKTGITTSAEWISIHHNV